MAVGVKNVGSQSRTPYRGLAREIAGKPTVLVTRSVIAASAVIALVSACSGPSSNPSSQSPAASAVSSDDWFINKLEAGGIQASYSRSWWIDAGHRVCKMLQMGMTPDKVGATIQAPGIPNSGYVVAASIQAYCPKYAR
jgi:hypothetical protein